MTRFSSFLWTPKKHRKFTNDKLFAYFVGLLGLSGIIYTFLQSHVTGVNDTDILYVDRETLEIEKGGRYAVLLKRAVLKGTVENNSLDNDETNIFQKAKHFVNERTENSDNTVFENLTSTSYKFLEDDSSLKKLLRNDSRTDRLQKCNKLFDADVNAFLDANLHMSKRKRKAIDNHTYRQMTSNCARFKVDRGYIDSPITEIERDFPLAYSIIAYKQVEQIERLLRAIYRPQNFYCIHLDSKTFQDDVITMMSIANCFPNVFMSSRSVDVKWGEFSVLEAELVCMKDLWEKKGWKYFINLTGQEFPLKTNLELVEILRASQAANLVDGTWVR